MLLLRTRQILPTRLWFSVRDTKYTPSDAKNLTNQKYVIKNGIKLSAEHSRPTKEETSHACVWKTLGI